MTLAITWNGLMDLKEPWEGRKVRKSLLKGLVG